MYSALVEKGLFKFKVSIGIKWHQCYTSWAFVNYFGLPNELVFPVPTLLERHNYVVTAITASKYISPWNIQVHKVLIFIKERYLLEMYQFKVNLVIMLRRTVTIPIKIIYCIIMFVKN